MRKLSLQSLLIALAVLLFVPSVLIDAQTVTTPTPAPIRYGNIPPSTLNDAVADIGTRVGRTITLADFDNSKSGWIWLYREFKNSALDCAAPGEATTAVVTLGYEYFFNLNGKTYDYRVPQGADKTKLKFCANPDKLPTLPTPAPTQVFSNTTTTGTTTNANGTPVASTGVFREDGTPEAVFDALADLSTRVGVTLAISDVSTGSTYWKWQGRDFVNDALECPKTGYTPITGTYAGYVITFLYKYQIYEYRASDNPKQVFLCRFL